MSSSGVLFDRYHHRYSVRGKNVPSVTDILAPLTNLRMVRAEVLHAAAHLGTAVHKACELDDLGQLDESSVIPALSGYLTAWRRFCADHTARWMRIESCVYHEQMGYAGTVDRYGLVDGAPAVVDLKTSAGLPPTIGPQLAAYAKAIPEASAGVRRIGVLLKPGGHYLTQDYSSPTDWAVFASLLTLQNFCQTHRITPYFKEVSR